MDTAYKKIMRFHNTCTNNGNGGHTRYLSWEWCHKAFLDAHNWVMTNKIQDENIKNMPKIDNLALHLAFYLASWGMYRGSSELLQHDYKVHTGAVVILLNSKYIDLWDYDPIDGININNAADLLFELYNNLEAHYNNNYHITPSETLITKILMGTLACVPAFDRFLKKGIKILDNKKGNPYDLNMDGAKCSQTLNKKTFINLCNLYVQNTSIFTNNTLKEIIDNPLKPGTGNNTVGRVMYPPMKLIDMFLWQIGFEHDIIGNSNGGTVPTKYINYLNLWGSSGTLATYNDLSSWNN